MQQKILKTLKGSLRHSYLHNSDLPPQYFTCAPNSLHGSRVAMAWRLPRDTVTARAYSYRIIFLARPRTLTLHSFFASLMEETVYNLSRDGLLQMRKSLHALPANAVEAESWAQSFSDALVRFLPYRRSQPRSLMHVERAGVPESSRSKQRTEGPRSQCPSGRSTLSNFPIRKSFLAHSFSPTRH
jgi:hypothetical protein